MDPLAGFSQAVGNLKRLLVEVPGTALLRADLAAFGALAHGAAFTAFPRHQQRAAHRAARPGGPAVPGRTELALRAAAWSHGFFLGETLAKRFAAGLAPVCRCAACDGLAPDTFDEIWTGRCRPPPTTRRC